MGGLWPRVSELGMLRPVHARATRPFGFAALIASLTASSASAQDTLATSPRPVIGGPQAVALARAAFEYRDFEKVVELLDPWLHPPRLVDPQLRVEGRRLLGVSLHLLGNVKGAREEFAQLLELEPDHALDAFVTPPAVIQSFEAVRAEMKPALDARRPPPPVLSLDASTKMILHPAVNFLPFGIPQFIQDQPAWGAVWAVLQAGFLALNLVGFFQAESFRKVQGDAYRDWLVLQYAGLAGLTGAWTASSLQGYLRWKSRSPGLPLMGPNPATQIAPTSTQVTLKF